MHRLWWVVTAITEALVSGSLETSVSLKRLMGQVDREMKRLISIGEKRYAAQPPRSGSSEVDDCPLAIATAPRGQHDLRH